MSVSRKQVIDRAKELGATIAALGVTSSGRMFEAVIDAPGRSVFCTTGCHCITVSVFAGKGAAAVVYKDALADMEMGTEKCGIEDCDICEEEKE